MTDEPLERVNGLHPSKRWDFVEAYNAALAKVRESGVDVAELEKELQPVGRARRYAELAAPALMKQALALLLGTDPEELDRMRGGVRLVLEGTKVLHGMVGLRTGEEVGVDLSERMQSFLTAWQERRALAQGDVIDAEVEGDVDRS